MNIRTTHTSWQCTEDHDGAGTPMYQAPEVLQNAGVGKGTDVFSFGIMMWEMISGESPYEGLSLNEMKSAVLAGARPSIKAGWSKEWTDIMRSCWAQDPSKRPTFVTLDQMLTQMQPSQRMQFSAPDADAVAHMVQQATRSASKGVESGPLFQHQPAAAHFSQSASSGTSYGGPGMMSHGSMKSQMQGQAMLSPEVAHARQAPPVHMPPHPQHQTPNSPHVSHVVA
jgi:serine/threonine protein kinase